jgi:hypothetical protein
MRLTGGAVEYHAGAFGESDALEPIQEAA